MTYQFKTEPYEHQRKALELGSDIAFFAYFMDMGTGKSKVLLDNVAMLHQQERISCACIIAPKSVYLNWSTNEVPAHFPDELATQVMCWSPANTKKNQEKRKLFLKQK